MHIYISQRALEEGMNAIVEEMVPFSYMMLREGYDAESIIQFLENAEDEDFDYIYEQADSEMLSESVVDEMSDEEVLLYEEQIGFIVENVILRNLLRKMSPAALEKFIKNNSAARRLAERLGLLKKGPTPKPTTTPKSTTPKPKSSRTSQQQAQTASQSPKPTNPTKTSPKTKPGGGILKSPAARTTATVLGGAAIGLGLNQAGLFPVLMIQILEMMVQDNLIHLLLQLILIMEVKIPIRILHQRNLDHQTKEQVVLGGLH